MIWLLRHVFGHVLSQFFGFLIEDGLELLELSLYLAFGIMFLQYHLLDLHEKLLRGVRDPLMDLNLAELGVSAAGIAEACNKHPFQDRINACVLFVGLLQPLSLDSQVQKRGKNACKEASPLRILDCFGREVVLDYDAGIKGGKVDLWTFS